jgi:hypothetical protein
MDPRFVATSKLLIEHGWDVGEAGKREYSAAELDAVADVSWPWEGLQRAVIAGLQGIQAQWGHLGGRCHLSLARLRSPQMSEV